MDASRPQAAAASSAVRSARGRGLERIASGRGTRRARPRAALRKRFSPSGRQRPLVVRDARRSGRHGDRVTNQQPLHGRPQAAERDGIITARARVRSAFGSSARKARCSSSQRLTKNSRSRWAVSASASRPRACGLLRLVGEPAGEHVRVVEPAERPPAARAARPAPSTPGRGSRPGPPPCSAAAGSRSGPGAARGVEALADRVELRDERQVGLLRLLAQPHEDREHGLAGAALDRLQVAPQARDLEVQHRLGQAPAAAVARPRQRAPQRLAPRASPARLAQPRRRAAPGSRPGRGCPRRRGSRPAARPGPAHALAPGLAGQERQRHAQPPRRHAHLVDLLLVAGQRLGQVAEEAPRSLLQQLRGGIGRGSWEVVMTGVPRGRRLPQATTLRQ